MSESDMEDKSWQRWMPSVLIVAIAVVWFSTPFFSYWLYGFVHKMIPQAEKLGVLGDTFGVANSLFSGLAFALLIYSSWMQRESLRLTQKELELTRKEVSGQRQALENQSQHLERQGFERTFFEMLAVQQRNLDSLQHGSTAGITAADAMLHEFQRGIALQEIAVGVESAFCLNEYSRRYGNYERYLGQYFRVLYSILKFVDESAIDDKQTYARIVRAQLSSSELSLLFHNGLSSHATKMKPLIEKYGLLKHCREDQIKGYAVLKPLYAGSAFGSSS